MGTDLWDLWIFFFLFIPVLGVLSVGFLPVQRCHIVKLHTMNNLFFQDQRLIEYLCRLRLLWGDLIRKANSSSLSIQT